MTDLIIEGTNKHKVLHTWRFFQYVQNMLMLKEEQEG